MLNYFDNLWTGASLHPARWLYTSNRLEVMVCVLTTLASFLFMFFTIAGILAVISLTVWFFAVIRPDRCYTISANDTTLRIAIFQTGNRVLKNRKVDKSCQSALMRFSKLFGQQTKPSSISVQKIFGFDEGYLSSQMFLFKTSVENWTLVSGRYPNTLFLGRHMKDNLYKDNPKTSGNVTILHGNTAVRFMVSKVDYFPHYTYDRKKAQYQPIASSEPQVPDFDACKKLALEYRGRKKLFLIGISYGHIPMAFQIKVPYVYASRRETSNVPISLSHEDWSFATKNYYG